MTAIKIRSGRVRSGTLRGPADSSRATSPLLYTPLISKTNKNVLQIFKSLYATPVHAGDWAAKGSSIQLPSDIKSMWSAVQYQGSGTPAINQTSYNIFDSIGSSTAKEKFAQSFSQVSGTVYGVSLQLSKSQSLGDGVLVELRDSLSGVPGNSVLARAYRYGDSLSVSDSIYFFSFGPNGVPVNSSTTYWIVVSRTGALNASAYPRLSLAYSSNPYANGKTMVFNNSVWLNYQDTSNTDFVFTVYTSQSALIHLTTQETTGRVAYHMFDTSTDTWSIKNELVVQAGTTGGYPAVSHVVLSDGSVVVAYANTATSDLYYIKRSSGTWGTAASLSSPGYGVVATLGTSDRVHFIFKGSSALLLHKSLTSGGTLNGSNTIDSTTASTIPLFPIGPGATTSGGTIAVPYKDADNNVSVVKFTSADSPTFTIDTAVSAASAYEFTNTLVAQTLANGTDLHLIYADNSAQDIFLDKNSGAGWGTDVELLDGVTAQGISAAVLT